jgi:hypothetical protein
VGVDPERRRSIRVPEPPSHRADIYTGAYSLSGAEVAQFVQVGANAKLLGEVAVIVGKTVRQHR